MSHPIIEIRFEFYDEVAPPEPLTRYWYHAPRVGDSVNLRLGEPTAELTGNIIGVVDSVEWFEEWVVVRVK